MVARTVAITVITFCAHYRLLEPVLREGKVGEDLLIPGGGALFLIPMTFLVDRRIWGQSQLEGSFFGII